MLLTRKISQYFKFLWKKRVKGMEMYVAGTLKFKDLSNFTKVLGLLKLKGWISPELDGSLKSFQDLTSISLVASKEESIYSINFLNSKLNEDLDFLRFILGFSHTGILKVALKRDDQEDSFQFLELRENGVLKHRPEELSRLFGIPLRDENWSILVDSFLN